MFSPFSIQRSTTWWRRWVTILVTPKEVTFSVDSKGERVTLLRLEEEVPKVETDFRTSHWDAAAVGGDDDFGNGLQGVPATKIFSDMLRKISDALTSWRQRHTPCRRRRPSCCYSCSRSLLPIDLLLINSDFDFQFFFKFYSLLWLSCWRIYAHITSR